LAIPVRTARSGFPPSRDRQDRIEAIRFENALTLEPVFCGSPPLREEPRKNGAPASGVFGLQGRARTPGAPHQYVRLRCPFVLSVYDSRWEANESLELDRNPKVRAWVKNDHTGFEITYSFKGAKAADKSVRPTRDHSQIPARLPGSAGKRENAGPGSEGSGRSAATN